MGKLFKLKNTIQEAVAPIEYRCIGCGVDVFDQTGFCKHCLKDVTFNNGKTCKLCGVAIHGAEDYCGRCAFERNYFDRAYSPFSYGGVIQHAILKMKFQNVASIAKVLARYLVYTCVKNQLEFDLVTFVPMTKEARRKRGYNQSQLLAQYFCQIADLPEPVSTLTKTKETARQEQLGKEERKQNLVGAFAADAVVKGKTILLIDDIKTTGSTLNECAKALKRKGAVKVLCLTVASREEQLQNELPSEL